MRSINKATINDVASLAGVSIKTVSRVTNREPNVRPATRERVERAIKELNYRPDQSARNLASHRSHLVGLVYDDPAPSAGYILRMQEGALRACKAATSELLIHPCNYSKRDVGKGLRSLIQEARPAGIIVAAPLSNMPKIIRTIESTGTPCVRLSPGDDKGKHFTIATNDQAISAEMTQYLASLGHRKIAYITGHPNHKAVANRFLGYQEGLVKSGLKFSERLVVAGDNTFGSGEEGALKLLKRKHRPTAFFAANDDMAVGVLRAANRLGIRVPEDLSVAGFDDITLARQVWPSLTTIRQPLRYMAERAAEILINSKNAVAPNGGVEVVPAKLQIRESTGPAPG